MSSFGSSTVLPPSAEPRLHPTSTLWALRAGVSSKEFSLEKALQQLAAYRSDLAELRQVQHIVVQALLKLVYRLERYEIVDLSEFALPDGIARQVSKEVAEQSSHFLHRPKRKQTEDVSLWPAVQGASPPGEASDGGATAQMTRSGQRAMTPDAYTSSRTLLSPTASSGLGRSLDASPVASEAIKELKSTKAQLAKLQGLYRDHQLGAVREVQSLRESLLAAEERARTAESELAMKKQQLDAVVKAESVENDAPRRVITFEGGTPTDDLSRKPAVRRVDSTKSKLDVALYDPLNHLPPAEREICQKIIDIVIAEERSKSMEDIERSMSLKRMKGANGDAAAAKRIEELEGYLAKSRAALESAHEEIKHLLSEKGAASRDSVDVDRQQRLYEAQIQALSEAKEQVEGDLADAKLRINSLTASMDQLDAQLSAAKSQIAELQSQLSSKESAAEGALRKRELEIRERERLAQEALQRARAELEAAQRYAVELANQRPPERIPPEIEDALESVGTDAELLAGALEEAARGAPVDATQQKLADILAGGPVIDFPHEKMRTALREMHHLKMVLTNYHKNVAGRRGLEPRSEPRAESPERAVVPAVAVTVTEAPDPAVVHENQELKSQLAHQRRNEDALRAELESLTAKNTKHQARVKELRGQLNALETERDKLLTVIAELQRRIAALPASGDREDVDALLQSTGLAAVVYERSTNVWERLYVDARERRDRAETLTMERSTALASEAAELREQLQADASALGAKSTGLRDMVKAAPGMDSRWVRDLLAAIDREALSWRLLTQPQSERPQSIGARPFALDERRSHSPARTPLRGSPVERTTRKLSTPYSDGAWFAAVKTSPLKPIAKRKTSEPCASCSQLEAELAALRQAAARERAMRKVRASTASQGLFGRYMDLMKDELLVDSGKDVLLEDRRLR